MGKNIAQQVRCRRIHYA